MAVDLETSLSLEFLRRSSSGHFFAFVITGTTANEVRINPLALTDGLVATGTNEMA